MTPVAVQRPPVAVAHVPEAPGRAGHRVTPLERLVFGGAMAAIALYALDDAFVHREPGTAVGDHLVSGLVPVALAALSAAVQPRLRPGGRAALALAWAPCALTAGVADGVRHVAVDRLAGDDASALLTALAGVALLVLGVHTLWTSRRRDDPRTRRYARRAVTTLVGVFAGLFVVMPVCFAILATRHARQPIAPADLGRPYQEVSFETVDGLRLDGWYVPSRNGAAVIVFPGRRGGTLARARLLAEHGYGVLLFDRRGEGTSEGDFNALGWDGEPDLVAAVDFLSSRPDVDRARIGGLGLSVGGELLLQTAARDGRLAGVVSEGAGIRSLREQLDNPDAPAALRWLSPVAVQTAATAVLAGGGPPPDLAALMPRIAPRPVLLIRARDGNGDEALNDVYFERAGQPKTLWTLPTGGHTGALQAAPSAYERRVTAFFDDALRRGS